MAYAESGGYLGTLKAGADYSVDHDSTDNQFRIMILNASVEGEVVRAGAATDVPLPMGILENKPGDGQVAVIREIQAGGIAKVQFATGQDVSPGDLIGSDADGRAVVVSTTEDHGIGVAISADAATGDGTILSVLLRPFRVE